MSKEELLKYLIAEIDLIMHDKDYRFENANGTWYSRESCRDLTNEEVFEELRSELRQFANLEAKLVEKEKEIAYLTKQVKRFNNEAQKYFEDAYCNDFQNQNKISFCIEQLEKVKEKLLEELQNVTDLLDSLEYEDYHEFIGCGRGYKNSIEEIDSKIKQLKGDEVE